MWKSSLTRAQNFGRWAALVPLIVAGWKPAALNAQTALSQTVNSFAERPHAPRVRIEVSLDDRTLTVLSGRDTLRTAPIAIASGRELRIGNRSWRFETPLGSRSVKSKRADPLWRPPDWHYAEAALEHGLQLRTLPDAGVTLEDGRRVQLRGEEVSVQLESGGTWFPLPEDEHLVFDATLYIPPIGSRNRRVRGELGAFALDLGDGYLLHGTPDQASVGSAVTHGCLRLLDEDIAWLFEHIPVGTHVMIR